LESSVGEIYGAAIQFHSSLHEKKDIKIVVTDRTNNFLFNIFGAFNIR
jgi:hypothetical protein